MIRDAQTPSGADLAKMAEINAMDIHLATIAGDRDAPRLRPAFHAVLIDPALDPGPLPDEES